MKRLTTAGKAKYFGKLVEALMSINIKNTKSLSETAEQIALLQEKFTEVLTEVWDRAYALGYDDGKRVGIFDDKKN